MERNRGGRLRRPHVLVLAAAGVVVTVLAAVAVLLVVVPGDGEPSAVAPPALAPADPTSAPAPSPTATPTTSPTPPPAPTATATPAPTATPEPTPTPTATPTPLTTLSYDTYDTTGAVTTAGSYAFLTTADDDTTIAVTTYEALRDGTTTSLRIHTSDADDASQSGVFDDVETGDLFEWKQAEDCFVRYKVTSTPQPAAGAVARKFGVESIAYAFTGCSGAVTTGASVSVTWGWLPNLGGTSLTAPIVQGPFQLIPAGWTGATKPVGPRFPAGDPVPTVYTTSLAEARKLPHWREPDLPEGWAFTYAESGDEADVGYFRAFYDGLRLVISAYDIDAKYGLNEASETYNDSQTSVRETLQIAGRPAQVHYSITEGRFRVTLEVWDEATGVLYMLRGSPDLAALIAFAESMFDDMHPDRSAPVPPPDSVSLTYDSYDTTAAVATAGSYAFLTTAEGGTTTVVTTSEALRDGTTTTLRIHTSGADDTSRSDAFDEVEVGHLIEWKQADDCFVRYRVTSAPDPQAGVASREFAVREETYVFQACQTGSVPTATAVSFTVAAELPLEHLGGTRLTSFAVVHGMTQLAPDGVLTPCTQRSETDPNSARKVIQF
ncbi:MAG: hypothetical protein OXG95_03405, partial [Chloroflexi bacterium]|nr:hypothetical protein [Chloroflexota bacterium]